MTESKQVFISYTKVNEEWAEWVAWILDGKYDVKIQKWHIRPGMDFIQEMKDFIDKSDILVPILSPDYFESDFCKNEINPFLASDPVGKRREIIPVRGIKFDLPRHFLSRVYIDLVGLDEETAKQALLDGFRDNGKPETKPSFPVGSESSSNEPDGKLVFPGRYPEHWVVPHQRNPFFTGRDDILDKLHNSFKDSRSLAITQAIKGLGGVGKSETANEYAYRYRNNYNAVFWVRSETPGERLKDFALIGAKLGITSGSDLEIFQQVRSRLEKNGGWLLVLDNVEDLASIQEVIPSPCKGRVLITTRSNATGGIIGYSLDCLDDEEGALLLLRRSKIGGEQDIISEDQHELARTISRTLGGLPLALDQAGAYIEKHECGLDVYLEIYQKNKGILYKRGQLSQETHPDSVAVTFSLCFDKVKQNNPESAQLLEMCAFLAPDDIPEEIFTDGASELPDDLKTAALNIESWQECIAAAAHLSLLVRNTQNKTFSIHRLVQEVLRQRMDDDKQKATVEHCVRALNKVYPDATEFKNWQQCSRLTPHAQSLFKWIEDYSIEFVEAASLLHLASTYFQLNARYSESEELQLLSISINEKVLDEDDPIIANQINNLALLYYSQGKYEQAEPFFLRAIEIDEKTLGKDHPQLATHLNNLAELYRAQGKDDQAEPLYLRAIEIGEKTLGAKHPNLAIRLNNLAGLYYSQGKYEQAGPLYLRVIEILEKALGKVHPNVATALNNLAGLYRAQGKYEQAEPLNLRAIEIDEKALEKDHPQLATHLNNLAGLYRAQGKYEQAEPLYLRTIEIIQKTLPDNHPYLAGGYENYAILLHKTGREAEALEYAIKAQAIHQKRGE